MDIHNFFFSQLWANLDQRFMVTFLHFTKHWCSISYPRSELEEARQFSDDDLVNYGIWGFIAGLSDYFIRWDRNIFGSNNLHKHWKIKPFCIRNAMVTTTATTTTTTTTTTAAPSFRKKNKNKKNKVNTGFWLVDNTHLWLVNFRVKRRTRSTTSRAESEKWRRRWRWMRNKY